MIVLTDKRGYTIEEGANKWTGKNSRKLLMEIAGLLGAYIEFRNVSQNRSYIKNFNGKQFTIDQQQSCENEMAAFILQKLREVK